VRQLRRHTGLRVTAEGAAEIFGERISDQHRRTRAGLRIAGSHSLASCSKRSPGECRVDANPWMQGTTWRRPIGRRSRHRLGRRVSDRPPITVHLFAHSTQPARARQRFISIALRYGRNPATLRSGAARRVPSSDPIRRTGCPCLADRENDETFCGEYARGFRPRFSGCPSSFRCARSTCVACPARDDQPDAVARACDACHRSLQPERC
jgi:hypothetical protein